MTDNDLYYRQRIEDELAAADAAKDAATSRIHRHMAELYSDLISIDYPGGKRPSAAPGTVLG